jgi:hypothetical protein
VTYDPVPLLLPGGTVPFAFLPGGFRQVAPWLPNGAIVSAARDVVYLPGTAHLRRRLTRQRAAALETASTPRLPLIQVPPTALAGHDQKGRASSGNMG